MINRDSNPVGWTLLVSELEDAREHLGVMLQDMSSAEDYSEEEFRIDLGHVYAHINRAWRRRLVAEDLNDDEWEQAREFPDDIDPIA